MKINKDLLKKISSYGVGILFCLSIGNLVAYFTETKVLQYVSPNFATTVNWITFITFVIYFGYFGIRKIKEFWSAVPVVLGQPIPSYIISSGYFWQLPKPFMSYIPVYTGQRGLDVPTVTALSLDQIEVSIDAQIQARVTEPYNWARTEDADKALLTLGERNLRILINTHPLKAIPGLKQQFSKDLEDGVTEFIEYDKNGDPTGKTITTGEEVKAVKTEAGMWGFKDGIDKCLVNKITIPPEITKAKAQEQVEQAQAVSEKTQQNLLYDLLGAGDMELGKKDWLALPSDERAKILQAERGKRTVVTVDGNAGDFTKGSVAAKAIDKKGS